MPRNTRHVDGPSSFDKASGSLGILQVSISSAKLFEHSLLLGWPVVMKSSRKWSRLVTPCSIAIHWSPSAMALKILGADLSPNGSTVSI